MSCRYIINTKTLNMFMTNNIKKKDIKNNNNILYLGSIINGCQDVYLIVDPYV